MTPRNHLEINWPLRDTFHGSPVGNSKLNKTLQHFQQFKGSFKLKNNFDKSGASKGTMMSTVNRSIYVYRTLNQYHNCPGLPRKSFDKSGSKITHQGQ